MTDTADPHWPVEDPPADTDLRRAVVALHHTPMTVDEITRMVRGYGWDVTDVDVVEILQAEDIRPRRRDVRAGDPVLLRRLLGVRPRPRGRAA